MFFSLHTTRRLSTLRRPTCRTLLPSPVVYQCTASLWTAVHATCSNESNLLTAIQQCNTNLDQIAANTTRGCSNSPQQTLRLIYANRNYTDTELLALPQYCTETFTRRSTQLSDTPTVQVGSVVDAINGQDSTPALAVVEMYFDSNTTRLESFHVAASQLPRRRTNSVGRWPDLTRYRPRTSRSDDIRSTTSTNESKWTSMNFESITRAPLSDCLPHNLKVAVKDNWSLQAFLLATDQEPYALFEVINKQFPQASVMGGVAASTPFITGLPYTMFYNDQTIEDGVVGVAIMSNTLKDGAIKSKRSFASLAPIGYPMTITRCRGNVIVELDKQAAISTLLAHYRSTQSQKRKVTLSTADYFIGVYPSVSTKVDKNIPRLPNEARLLGKIISGDPSRGQLAIDTLGDLEPGEQIQFFICNNESRPANSDDDNEDYTTALSWQVFSPTNKQIVSLPLTIGCENGIILSTGINNNESSSSSSDVSLHTWLCSVPNGQQILLSKSSN